MVQDPRDRQDRQDQKDRQDQRENRDPWDHPVSKDLKVLLVLEDPLDHLEARDLRVSMARPVPEVFRDQLVLGVLADLLESLVLKERTVCHPRVFPVSWDPLDQRVLSVLQVLRVDQVSLVLPDVQDPLVPRAQKV